MGKRDFKRTLRAKLSFDEGFAENPIYTLKAFTNEKEKGIYMLKLIEDNFSISVKDRILHDQIEIECFEDDVKGFENGKDGRSVKWTRDERGNIISPFSRKEKKPS